MKGFCECLGVGRVKECKSLKKNAIFTVKVDISQKSEIFYRGNVEINKMYVSGLNTLPCVHGFLLFAFSSRVYFNLQFSQNIILILEIHPHERALEPHKIAVAILNN